LRLLLLSRSLNEELRPWHIIYAHDDYGRKLFRHLIEELLRIVLALCFTDHSINDRIWAFPRDIEIWSIENDPFD
jgi:hypothetical protein